VVEELQAAVPEEPSPRSAAAAVRSAGQAEALEVDQAEVLEAEALEVGAPAEADREPAGGDPAEAGPAVALEVVGDLAVVLEAEGRQEEGEASLHSWVSSGPIPWLR